MLIRKFLQALWKHWWALMSSAALSIVAIYAAEQNKTNKWVFRASCTAAVLMFLIAAFRAWSEEYTRLLVAMATISEIEAEDRQIDRRRVRAELEKLEEENRRIAERRAMDDLDNRLLALIRESLAEMRKRNEMHSNIQAYTTEFFASAAVRLGVSEDAIRESMHRLKNAKRMPGLADLILVSPWSRL